MINITHEFPLQFYLNGFAKAHTDYDYCLVHRYLENSEYREYMKAQVAEGRTVYLDNSLYELGEAWNDDEYADVIRDLKPTYYMLPDVFSGGEENEKRQFNFIKNYPDLPSKPIAIPHAQNIFDLGIQLEKFCKEMPESAMMAIPFADVSLLNKSEEVGYFNSKDIKYDPLRQALNRKLFLGTWRHVLGNRKIHLLGCKSLAEFDDWWSTFPKENIVSLDTSHPVALTLEGPCHHYHWGFFLLDDGTKMASHFYKPSFLIDKHFEEKFDEDLLPNLEYFQNTVRRWHTL